MIALAGSTLDVLYYDPAGNPACSFFLGDKECLSVTTYSAGTAPALTAPGAGLPLNAARLYNNSLYTVLVGSAYNFGGNAVPGSPLAFYQVSGAIAIAVDGSGNVVVSESAGLPFSTVDAVLAFSGTGVGTVAPLTTYSSASIGHPAGLDFDSKGNLWIVNSTTGDVVGFAPPNGTSLGTPIGSFNVPNAFYATASR
jgi:hypothetical protein